MKIPALQYNGCQQRTPAATVAMERVARRAMNEVSITRRHADEATHNKPIMSIVLNASTKITTKLWTRLIISPRHTSLGRLGGEIRTMKDE